MCKKKQFKYCPSEIDSCMKILIKNLNVRGIKTYASCCGHNKYPMTIIVKDALGFYDLCSNKTIPRKRRFYKKDKEGYYYIPEVLDYPIIRKRNIGFSKTKVRFLVGKKGNKKSVTFTARR